MRTWRAIHHYYLMCCSRGVFPTIRLNEVHDLLADWLTEVCSTVAVEPRLVPLSGEMFAAASTITALEAHTSARARGLWTRAQVTFFDVRVIHPDAKSYVERDIDGLLVHKEQVKMKEYGERIMNVDSGTFCPCLHHFWFVCTGVHPPFKMPMRRHGQGRDKPLLLYRLLCP